MFFRICHLALHIRCQWIVQDLPADSRAFPVSCQHGDYGREVAAGTIAADADVFGVSSVIPYILAGPYERIICLVKSLRKLVFRGQVVIGSHHDHASVAGQVSAHILVYINAVHRERAAVVEYDCRARLLHFRRIDPKAYGPVASI